MGDRVKSYLVFTSFFYRIVMYAVIPVVLVGIGVLTGTAVNGTVEGAVLAAAVAVGVLLSTAEIISDVWLFGGIQKKEGTNLEYLKTSGRGMQIMRDALIVELARKFLTAVGTVAVCGGGLACLDGNGAAVGRVAVSLLHIALTSYFFTVLGTVIARFWDMLWVNYMVSYVAAILQGLSLLIPGWERIGGAVILAVLCVLASVAAVKLPLRRMEGSYYDK